MPVFVLTLTYWLHLLATITWLGGLAMLILVARPGADSTEPAHRAVFESLERRFRPFANVSLIVLLVTGMIQMGGDPHYEGFLKIGNTWSLGLLLKHLVFAAMIAISAVVQWGVRPALERASLLARHGGESDQAMEAILRRRLMRLTALNLTLGILVLLLTALITAL